MTADIDLSVPSPFIVSTRKDSDGDLEFLVYELRFDKWGQAIYIPSGLEPLNAYQVSVLCKAFAGAMGAII